MKTYHIIAALLFGFIITANAQKRIETTELPKPAQEFLQKYFSYTTVDIAKKDAEHGEKGYEVILEHGDTLFMPAGYWHHMEYLDSGFAMSLRALQPSLTGKLKGAWNLFGMRSIDTLMKKTAPVWWYENKKKKIFANAERELQSV